MDVSVLMTGEWLALCVMLPLAAGVLLDAWLGDPSWLPHPVVGFGKLIAGAERRWNRGQHRKLKGALTALALVAGTWASSALLLGVAYRCSVGLYILLSSVGIFYCLAGKTLVQEVRWVFEAADRSLDEGRQQVSRIVGRDTSGLTDREVRTAALETLAENLSDGVIAPLCWLLIAGVPGMLAYKMINTLDSMVGYRTERYRAFGCWAARMDDVANYLPARITAFLMLLVAGRLNLFGFVRRYGPQHASPNSGYPESALAGILNCRFGGPHRYFGEMVYKPFIGTTERALTSEDMRKAIAVNRRAEAVMVIGMLGGCLGLMLFL